MRPFHTFYSCPVLIGQGMGVSVPAVCGLFRDGRVGGLYVEELFKTVGMQPRLPGDHYYDGIDLAGQKWELRSITKTGTAFSPARMRGAGREFKGAGFKRVLERIRGFVLCDVTTFPVLPCWAVDVESVRRWEDLGYLRANMGVCRRRLFQCLSEDQTSPKIKLDV